MLGTFATPPSYLIVIFCFFADGMRTPNPFGEKSYAPTFKKIIKDQSLKLTTPFLIVKGKLLKTLEDSMKNVSEKECVMRLPA